MKFIIYSETTASSIQANLGVAEYSYYFIFRGYQPVLESLGDLVYVDDPAREVDPIYHDCKARGEGAVFLSFSPPHRTCRDLDCPTVCILAWEFSSIPAEDMGQGESDNWERALREIGNVMTISDYSTDVIAGQIGAGLHIATVPAPVTDKAVEALPPRQSGTRQLSVSCGLIDTRQLAITDTIAYPLEDGGIGDARLPAWDGADADFIFDGYTRENNGVRFLVGFHTPEEWGAWAWSDQPWVNLPFIVSGDFELTLKLVGFAGNVGRTIGVSIGGVTRELVLDDELQDYTLDFSGVDDSSTVTFSNLEPGYTIGAEMLRILSVGLGGLSLRDRSAVGRETVTAAASAQEAPARVLDLDGVVYTTVFNPEDGRKNWEDIVKAFCWAFREDAGRTLVLKLSCPTMTATWGKLLTLFSQLNPFACRIVAIYGYLSDEEMAQLVNVTDFVVNASHAEGQCLPLLEFMAEGVPAIAPDHTAMASYINTDNALVVDSWRRATCWPQDPRQVNRTFFYDTSWESLLDCFRRSATIAEQEPQRYQAMSNSAARIVREDFCIDRCRQQLERYFEAFAKPEGQA